MAKRDPEKTARNKEIAELTGKLRGILPNVFKQTGYKTEATVNATIGSKSDSFIDLKHEVINSSEEFIQIWLQGLKAEADTDRLYPNAIDELWQKLQDSRAFQDYLLIFLRRSYLKHYDELSKARPLTEQAELWIGQNSADWGLLVTPRFAAGDWENDVSEIRHFQPRYWSIGHVLETGLVVPGKKRRQRFSDVDAYLEFFQNVLVRANKSSHGDALAERYVTHVQKAANPEEVLLLIPELRYAGRAAKHEYRLDFCIIDVAAGTRVGFELSPWSSHGQLAGTKGKTQAEINAEASANFARETRKLKNYFRRHGITVLVFTDEDLANPDELFAEVARYLTPKAAPRQLSLRILRDYFR
ncbi:hypothetical protein [Acidisoma silvae]|uniref:Topoisomerase II n=1 Tax=Acidisoma silvae TaxID=2802396 RepID=A0A963YWM5_9PROT|nr:hypothetical protein [Acidisoma silvae]MCB8878572.1 hypothetical protein [Acidisoma silvae]